MQSALRWIRRIGWQELASTAAAVAAAAAGLPIPAFATAEVDCVAISREPLQVDLTSAASATRFVELRPGETLRFAFEAEPGPFGSLTLIEGDGSPRALLVGPSGTTVSFTARHGGAFGFQFARKAESAARFTVACTPSRHTPSRTAAEGPALGHSSVPSDTGVLEEPQLAGLDAPLSRAAASAPAPQGAAPADGRAAVGAVREAGLGAQMKLQWLDQRYRTAGPEGPQVDPGASGVEVGVNYKLQTAVTVGALAQVNPAAEMLFGAQRSLVDQGWMAGPFTTIRLAPGLVLDARAAWGEGTAGLDEAPVTAAQRQTASARVAKEHAFGGWRFTPSVNFNYLHETLPGPASAPEAPHATAAARIDVGPELAYRTDLPSSAFIEPRLVLGGFWGLDDLANDAGAAHGHAPIRFKAEAGVTLGFYNGPKLQASGALEEGTEEAPDAWRGRLLLSVPLK